MHAFPSAATEYKLNLTMAVTGRQLIVSQCIVKRQYFEKKAETHLPFFDKDITSSNKHE